MQDLVDNNNKDRAKSTKDLFTFLLPAPLLPASLLWATLLSVPPPNAFKKRLNKACLSSVLKKWAKKAVNINMKLKMAIELYVLVILF